MTCVVSKFCFVSLTSPIIAETTSVRCNSCHHWLVVTSNRKHQWCKRLVVVNRQLLFLHWLDYCEWFLFRAVNILHAWLTKPFGTADMTFQPLDMYHFKVDLQTSTIDTLNEQLSPQRFFTWWAHAWKTYAAGTFSRTCHRIETAVLWIKRCFSTLIKASSTPCSHKLAPGVHYPINTAGLLPPLALLIICEHFVVSTCKMLTNTCEDLHQYNTI